MPKKSKSTKTAKPKTKKTYKKKAYKKKSGFKTKGMLNRYNKGDPFPPYMFKSMTYASSYAITRTATLSTTFATPFQFRLNDPYDPYIGTTPAVLDKTVNGMAELASLYNRMKVAGMRIEIEFFDPSADGLVVGCQVLNPANLASTIAGQDIGDIEARPQCWTKSIVNTGSQRVWFKQNFKMHDLFNITKIQYDANIEAFTQPTNGSPSTYPVLEVSCADSNGANTQKTLQFTIKLTYYTQFYQRKLLSQVP